MGTFTQFQELKKVEFESQQFNYVIFKKGVGKKKHYVYKCVFVNNKIYMCNT